MIQATWKDYRDAAVHLRVGVMVEQMLQNVT